MENLGSLFMAPDLNIEVEHVWSDQAIKGYRIYEPALFRYSIFSCLLWEVIAAH